jgi:hypothetical protein
MTIHIICCYTGKYHTNVLKVLHAFKNSSFTNFIIINQTEEKNKDFESYNEIITGKIGVSAARNIGLEIVKNNANLENDLIYFWDEDIFITNELINKVIKINIYNNFQAYIFGIKGFSGGKIGNKLITNNYFTFLNVYRLGNPSFIFKLKYIKTIFNENIGPGKLPIIAAEDTLFILQNNIRRLYIPDKNIYFLHPDAEDINTDNKIIEYSISQGVICKNFKFTDKFIFIIMVLHRPFFGIIINFKQRFLYKSRIQAFIYGYKKNYNI